MFEELKEQLIKNIKNIRNREGLTDEEQRLLVLETTMDYIKTTQDIIKGKDGKD